MKHFYIYILASRSRTLYVGMTNDLARRLYQHRNGEGSRFASRYRVDRLVYYEMTTDARAAIDRETAIKRWNREKKIRLIEKMNPGWEDLAEVLGLERLG